MYFVYIALAVTGGIVLYKALPDIIVWLFDHLAVILIIVALVAITILGNLFGNWLDSV